MTGRGMAMCVMRRTLMLTASSTSISATRGMMRERAEAAGTPLAEAVQNTLQGITDKAFPAGPDYPARRGYFNATVMS